MRNLLAFLLGLLLLPAGAGAGVELTLSAGFGAGRAIFPIEARISPDSPLVLVCVTTPCLLAEARTEEGAILPALILDVPITSAWMVEALLTRQDGDLGLASSLPPGIILDQETFEATTAQLGLLRHWGGGRLRPFVAGALGGTRFESSAQAYARPLFPGIVARPVNEEVLSGSLAGGIKAGISPRVAVRLEGRVFWHDLPERLGGSLWQQAASLGLTYRW